MVKTISNPAVMVLIAIALLFGGISVANASVDFDPIAPVVFDNGNGWESSVDGNAGNAFKTRVVFDVTADSDVNSVSFDKIGDFVGLECFQFNEVTQTVSNFPVEFNQKFPTPVGAHDYIYTLYGVDGAGQDFNCTEANAVDSVTVTDQVITNIGSTNTSSSTGGGSGESGASTLGASFEATIASLKAMIADLVKQIAELKNPPAPLQGAVCSQLAQYSYLSVGASGPAVGALQVLLMNNGGSIPAISSGKATYGGLYGPQTSAALWQVKTMNRCI